jgi:hypothetical protein
LKKLMILGALLAMLLMAFAPLVLAQQVADPILDVSEDTNTTTAPTVGPAVGCQELYDNPTAFCILDENGLITLPDGSTAPVVVEPDGSAFVIGADGNLTLIGEGASFIVEGEDTGDIQYDNEDGELPGTSLDTDG